jgi:deoxyribonuclease-2
MWLITSTPKFPPGGAWAYPSTGVEMAQTMLCISLPSVSVAVQLAHQMYHAHQPHVHAASPLKPGAALPAGDERALLMQDQVAPGTDPVTAIVPFTSRAGQKFLSIAKNKWWGLDFYNDLVGPALHENLEVETWERAKGKVPAPADSDKIHKVTAMQSVTLEPLGIPFSWSEEDDHAKLAISDPSESVHWVCVGDINYTDSMEKRGGGTAAFQCEPLWQALAKALSAQPEPAPLGR